jgi:preprotein translocase subunit SecB
MSKPDFKPEFSVEMKPPILLEASVETNRNLEVSDASDLLSMQSGFSIETKVFSQDPPGSIEGFVVLKGDFNVTTPKGRVAFLIECSYATEVKIRAENESSLMYAMHVDVPEKLEVIIREFVSETTIKMGGPPFNLSPADFKKGFYEHLKTIT